LNLPGHNIGKTASPTDSDDNHSRACGDQVGEDTANSPDSVWLFFGLRAAKATGTPAGIALPIEQTVYAESSAPFYIGSHQTIFVLFAPNCAGSACTLAPLCDSTSF
jgi:hypothetical protein